LHGDQTGSSEKEGVRNPKGDHPEVYRLSQKEGSVRRGIDRLEDRKVNRAARKSPGKKKSAKLETTKWSGQRIFRGRSREKPQHVAHASLRAGTLDYTHGGASQAGRNPPPRVRGEIYEKKCRLGRGSQTTRRWTEKGPGKVRRTAMAEVNHTKHADHCWSDKEA